MELKQDGQARRRETRGRTGESTDTGHETWRVGDTPNTRACATLTTASSGCDNARQGRALVWRTNAPYQTTLAAVSRRVTYQDLVRETGLPSWISTTSPSLNESSVWA